jgi:RimJ/RimL family protein N-acetyltransferase
VKRVTADPSVASIRTARLELVSMSIAFMRALVARDIPTAAREIGAAVPDDMPDDLVNFLQYRLAQVEADPTIVPWLGRGMVLADATNGRRVIGTIGFHGPPDDQGRVEVGYRVDPPYRRQGYAGEAVRALFDWAWSTHGITRFVASISPDNEASLRLADGFGFVEVGSHMDDIDGLEIEFETTWPRPA